MKFNIEDIKVGEYYYFNTGLGYSQKCKVDEIFPNSKYEVIRVELHTGHKALVAISNIVSKANKYSSLYTNVLGDG